MDQSKEITQYTFTIPANLRIRENAKKILSLHFAHPDWTYAQIGKEVGVTQSRVGQILRHPRILAAMPLIARQRVQGLSSKAVRAYEQLVDQNENLAVKEKAANKVLSETKVFDAPTLKVEGTLTILDVRQLQEKVRNAAKAADNIVEAEIVEPPEVV